MEIGFENVMLSDETREVAAHICGYIAKKVVKKFGHCCKNYCINESETASTTHVYIDLLSRGGLTLPSECLVAYVCDCFVFIDHAINVITSSKMKERLLQNISSMLRCFMNLFYALCTGVKDKA